MCQKTLGFSVLVFIAVYGFSVFEHLVALFAKNTNGFTVLISDAVFGFSSLTYLGPGFSSIWAAITHLHWSRIAAKRKCYREECVTNQLKYRRDLQVPHVKPYPPPPPRWVGVESTVTRKVRLCTEHCQCFFINAISKLVTKLQATCDWLINIPIESPNFQVLVRKWKC